MRTSSTLNYILVLTMELKLKTYRGVDNTLENMKNVIMRNFSQDYLKPFDKWSLQKVYNYIRNLPYVKDPENVPISDNDNIELVKSPYAMIMTNGGDCDDKATLFGAILHRRGIRYRMAIVQGPGTDTYHHVFPEIFLGGKWWPVDPTYPTWDKNHTPSQPFVESNFTKKKIYDWFTGKTVTQEINGRNVNSGYLSGSGNLSGTKLAILEGTNDRAQKLLGEPITATATIIASVASLFSGLFAKERYQDAYNVWAAAAGQLPGAVAAKDWALAGINRALVAVLGVDYMNPPWGKDVETSPGRKGNRAEWSKIQQAVEGKVAETAPFFAWLSQTNATDLSMEGLYRAYADYNSGGPLRQQFNSANRTSSSSQTTGLNIAGMNTSTILLIGLLGTAAYFILK